MHGMPASVTYIILPTYITSSLFSFLALLITHTLLVINNHNSEKDYGSLFGPPCMFLDFI